MIKNLLTYITLATVLLKLNKTLDADAKALFGEMHCLVYRIKNVMEDPNQEKLYVALFDKMIKN